jgi:hypothetical protein
MSICRTIQKCRQFRLWLLPTFNSMSWFTIVGVSSRQVTATSRIDRVTPCNALLLSLRGTNSTGLHWCELLQ